MTEQEYSLGISDEEFIRGNVPMTKEEVRILTLAKARIKSTDIVLDVGAGTGSLSIEAAFLANKGQVYAIERNEEAINLLKQNMEKFKRGNITVLEGVVPKVFVPIDVQLDVALIGGSGGNLEKILQEIDKRLAIGGRIIINAVTLETLSSSLELLKNRFKNYKYDVCCLQATRVRPLGNYSLFDAQNPVYIFVAVKLNNKEN